MEIENLKFDENGLIPAIIQDAETRTVLMLGYMNREALTLTLTNGKVCFFSRSRQKLWTKGEESGHFLYLKDIQADCDCHTGTDTCWGEKNEEADFLFFLQKFLQKRKNDAPEESYTARLISKGINKIAQKVGEEAVELVIEAKDDNEDLFLNEAADLMYHYLVLLIAKGYGLEDVIRVLKERHK